jgi:hypothetical protein
MLYMPNMSRLNNQVYMFYSEGNLSAAGHSNNTKQQAGKNTGLPFGVVVFFYVVL